jgi:S1-C subfamily serine protease
VLKEIGSLISNGSYDQHSTIGASGTDMTYEIAQRIGTDMTYGWLISQVTDGGPADQAGLRGGTQQVVVNGQNVVIGGDVIIKINGTRIKDMDDMSSFLEANTLPGQIIGVTVVRSGQVLTLSLTLGSHPSMT